MVRPTWFAGVPRVFERIHDGVLAVAYFLSLFSLCSSLSLCLSPLTISDFTFSGHAQKVHAVAYRLFEFVRSLPMDAHLHSLPQFLERWLGSQVVRTRLAEQDERWWSMRLLVRSSCVLQGQDGPRRPLTHHCVWWWTSAPRDSAVHAIVERGEKEKGENMPFSFLIELTRTMTTSRVFLCRCVQAYGLTETCAGGTFQLLTDEDTGIIGCPVGAVGESLVIFLFSFQQHMFFMSSRRCCRNQAS